MNIRSYLSRALLLFVLPLLSCNQDPPTRKTSYQVLIRQVGQHLFPPLRTEARSHTRALWADTLAAHPFTAVYEYDRD